jgi:hypothetical protein
MGNGSFAEIDDKYEPDRALLEELALERELKRFAIYRQPRRQFTLFSGWRPTRVATIAARSGREALELFVAGLPKGGGWADPHYVIKDEGRGGRRWRPDSVVLRRFTSSGMYKGETVFLTWEVER